ncbi:NAD(P)-binding protein [Lentithecium fluviatile CBS 122367]|uniref:NAD(P)-binding protein n=1 Tax=Lentithecium fluviatile CBS 122367 TaxID=1168545 RepID=A0A6G1IMV6_9PLEO|nr:NAD(P)-binding protein [Lentithecium fluviatile CBS 122367]
MTISGIWRQWYPPAPQFTEKNVAPGSAVGKVFIVTGGNSGVGFELVKSLYPSGATIYVAGRSVEKIEQAILKIRSLYPDVASPAQLRTLRLDLNDLASVKPAVAEFGALEHELHILWNNAGAWSAPGTSTQQGLEAHIGANCVAPLLFTQLLLPYMKVAVGKSEEASVRVIWSGSVQIEMSAPKDGIDFKRIEGGKTIKTQIDYAASKAGNLFLAHEGAKQWGRDGVISVCGNPGNLMTGIYATQNWFTMLILKHLVLYEPRFGAYTMLYSAFSPDITMAQNGAYIWPWGKIRPNSRADINNAIGKGKAMEFWQWCEEKFKAYL